MPLTRIRYLVERYLNGTCTPQEQSELYTLVSQSQNDEALKAALDEAWKTYEPDTVMPAAVSGRILSNVFTNAKPIQAGRQRNWWWAAAAVLLAAGGATYLVTRQPAAPKQVAVIASQQQRFANEVQPGGNKALLKLADGTVIELDSAANGVLAQQGGTKVTKLANGELAYQQNGNNNGQPTYNTMVTPRGGAYRLTLPDGSMVWLNASSSITYPTAFTGSERNVSVTGEAYFEVAKNEQQPFKVKARDLEVLILGTAFNINAYDDEAAIKTTLLEGAVKVTANGNSTAPIHPGEQVIYAADKALKVANNVNTDEAIAWKNGYFQFNDADMPTVMRQLEKWYDVEVVYEGKVPKRSFGGGMQRTLPLTKVLQILEENDVKFKLAGQKIIVMK